MHFLNDKSYVQTIQLMVHSFLAEAALQILLMVLSYLAVVAPPILLMILSYLHYRFMTQKLKLEHSHRIMASPQQSLLITTAVFHAM